MKKTSLQIWLIVLSWRLDKIQEAQTWALNENDYFTVLYMSYSVGCLQECYQRCAYSHLVISERVLHLFHNNEYGYSWSSLLLRLCITCQVPNYHCYSLLLLISEFRVCLLSSLSCTVLCKSLNMCLANW